MQSTPFSMPHHVVTMTRSLIANAVADYGCIFLMRDDTLRMVSAGRRGALSIDVDLCDTYPPPDLAWPQSTIDRVAQRREKEVLPLESGPNPYGDDLYFANRPGRSCLCLPLVVGPGLIGVVYLERDSPRSGFDTDQQRAVALLVDQVAEYLLLNASLMAERNLLRTVVDAIPDLVFVKDTEGKFIVANLAVVEAFALTSAEQLIGKSDFDFFPAEEVMHIYEDEQTIMRTGVAHLDHQELNTSLGGVARWFSTTKVPVWNTERVVTGLVGSCREITEHKLYELDLERRNAELALLNAQLSHTQEQLVRSERMAALGALVAGIAHELNTPIGIGVTVASTLHDQTWGLLNEVAQGALRRSSLDKYLSDVAKGTELLLKALGSASDLVASFKQVAVDQSSSQRRMFDLSQVLEEIAAMLGPMFKKTPYILQLNLQSGLELDSFPGPLGQVINNLLSNALLHGFDGRANGLMQITTCRLNEQAVELCFSDDGAGIPEKNISRVFDPFFTTRLGQGGSGLGMNIVYNIVTGILGGSIRLESHCGHGTKVVMLLPISAPNFINKVL